MSNNEARESYREFTKIVGIVFFVKLLIGGLLIVLGCLGAFWILQTIFHLIETPEKIAIMQEIAKIETKGVELKLAGQNIQFPPIIFQYGNVMVGYGIIIILLAIAAGLVKAFLYTGAGLVKSDIQALLEKLGEQLARVWSAQEASREK